MVPVGGQGKSGQVVNIVRNGKIMKRTWEHVPNCLTPPPLTPLWEHKSLGTFYFGNIDFGITRCFDSQGPKLGG